MKFSKSIFVLALLLTTLFLPKMQLQAQSPLAELSYKETLPIKPSKKAKKVKKPKKRFQKRPLNTKVNETFIFALFTFSPALISLSLFIVGQLLLIPALWWIGLILIGGFSLLWFILFLTSAKENSDESKTGLNSLLLVFGAVHALTNGIVLLPLGLIIGNSLMWIVGASALGLGLLFGLFLLLL